MVLSNKIVLKDMLISLIYFINLNIISNLIKTNIIIWNNKNETYQFQYFSATITIIFSIIRWNNLLSWQKHMIKLTQLYSICQLSNNNYDIFLPAYNEIIINLPSTQNDHQNPKSKTPNNIILTSCKTPFNFLYNII
jgi:hypothetical protein